MAKVFAMYKRPADPAAFDRYYYATHVPIAKKIPGRRGYEVTSGPVTTLVGPAPYHLVASSDAAASSVTEGWAASSSRALASTGSAARIGRVTVRVPDRASVNSTVPSRGASAAWRVAGPVRGTKLTGTSARRTPAGSPAVRWAEPSPPLRHPRLPAEVSLDSP